MSDAAGAPLSIFTFKKWRNNFPSQAAEPDQKQKESKRFSRRDKKPDPESNDQAKCDEFCDGPRQDLTRPTPLFFKRSPSFFRFGASVAFEFVQRLRLHMILGFRAQSFVSGRFDHFRKRRLFACRLRSVALRFKRRDPIQIVERCIGRREQLIGIPLGVEREKPIIPENRISNRRRDEHSFAARRRADHTIAILPNEGNIHGWARHRDCHARPRKRHARKLAQKSKERRHVYPIADRHKPNIPIVHVALAVASIAKRISPQNPVRNGNRIFGSALDQFRRLRERAFGCSPRTETGSTSIVDQGDQGRRRSLHRA